MTATDSKLLTRADRMSESSLVSLRDWELAYLRMAMLNSVEEAVNDSLQDSQFISQDLATNRIPRGSEVRGVRSDLVPTEIDTETHR